MVSLIEDSVKKKKEIPTGLFSFRFDSGFRLHKWTVAYGRSRA